MNSGKFCVRSYPPTSTPLSCLPIIAAAGFWGNASANRITLSADDHFQITASGPAILMAFLRSWVITALRKAGYDSITRAFRLVGHDIPKLLSFL